MSRYEGSPAVVIERRKGTPDSPFNNMNETLVVTGDGKVLLSEIPNELNRVVVTSADKATWYEVKEGQLEGNAFKVDYINKLVTFSTRHVGKQLHFRYVGEGNHYYSPHSIYTKLEDGTVVETLGDVVESGKDAIKALDTLNDKLDELDVAKNNAIIATDDAKAVIATTNAKITEVDNKIVDINTSLSGVDAKMLVVDGKLADIDNGLLDVDNKMLVVDGKIADWDVKLNDADTTIQTFNQLSDDASVIIANGQSVIDTAQLIADDLKSVGEFNVITAYKKNNIVSHNGSSWIALQDTHGNPIPILPVKENAYWRLVAHRGVDGNGAVASVNGMSPDINGNVQLDDIPDASSITKGLMTQSQAVKLSTISTGANYVHVEDSLTSTSTTSAASANKAKELSDKITDLTELVSTDHGNFTLVEDVNEKVHITFPKLYFNIGLDGKARYTPNGDGNSGVSLGDKLYIWKVKE